MIKKFKKWIWQEYMHFFKIAFMTVICEIVASDFNKTSKKNKRRKRK